MPETNQDELKRVPLEKVPSALANGLSGSFFVGTARAAQEGLAMSKMFAGKKLSAILSVATIGSALCLGLGQAAAGDNNVTEDQIVKALVVPKAPLTRGLSIGPQVDPEAVAAEGKLLHAVRGRNTRSLSVVEREEIATIAQDKPKIDLEINFDYNSADISSKSLPSVQALGKALTNSDLKGSTFIVAGYTDAAGGDSFNQDLSERRADAIKRYLMDKYSISSNDLVTVGYGKTKLKDPNQPLADVNRRVQVVNMANKDTTASK
jgi:outer membrane protein OmpA-like peptidoglycan-associated protein